MYKIQQWYHSDKCCDSNEYEDGNMTTKMKQDYEKSAGVSSIVTLASLSGNGQAWKCKAVGKVIKKLIS